MENVTYGSASETWNRYVTDIRGLIEQYSLKRICEVGGGANPAFGLDYVQRNGLDYTVLDISASELEKAPSGYHKMVADICAPDLEAFGEFDLVFSVMLAEHARNGKTFHRNVFRLLAKNGLACHFFPTLYAPPFVVNWLMPESLASWLLDRVYPRDRHKHGKFPAMYSWCRGPMPAQLNRLKSLGYEVVEYRGLFGHDLYYKRVPPVQKMSRRISEYLLRHPVPALTSYAFVVLRRPEQSEKQV